MRATMNDQQLMELAVSVAPSGLAVVDASGQVVSANPALHTLFGCEPGALRGHDLAAFLPDLHAWPAAAPVGPGRSVLTDDARGRRRVEATRRDGSRFHVDVRLEMAVRAGSGVVLAWVTDCAHPAGPGADGGTGQALDRALA